MSPVARRVLQAVLYEVVAIAFVGPVLSLAFNEPAASTFGLAVVPEPGAITLIAGGVIFLAGRRRSRSEVQNRR